MVSPALAFLTLALTASLQVLASPYHHAWPAEAKSGVVVPLARRVMLERRDVLGGVVGLGDIADEAYFISVDIGSSQALPLKLATVGADLVVISDTCQTVACRNYSAPRYKAEYFDSFGPAGSLFLGALDGDVDVLNLTMYYPSGRVGRDTVVVAALTGKNQTIGVADNIESSTPYSGAAGIFGLGFPEISFNSLYAINYTIGANISSDQPAINHSSDLGPIIPRLGSSGAIKESMFTLTLQRDSIDISGAGELSIGQLPDGIDNSSVTWVPVRLFNKAEWYFLLAPTFDTDSAYPMAWEVAIDAVFLNGEKLPTSTQPNSTEVHALVSVSDSAITGPPNVVNALYASLASDVGGYDGNRPTIPCGTAHNLTFEIGGKMFPVDPRDFIRPAKSGDAKSCVPNVVAAEPTPAYSWVLGTSFMKGNMIAFYYGNITHPSFDPPRIGFMSRVPQNASALLEEAVSQAQSVGGTFESTTQAAPTSGHLVTGTKTAIAPGHTSTSPSNDKPNGADGLSIMSAFTLIASVLGSFLFVV